MKSIVTNAIRLFLCGDVMTGRGIDQILPHPSDPVLHESYMRDARDYVSLAEAANGPISRPVGFKYIWGDALKELESVDLRIINLETSVTRSNDHWPDKGIHYRMHPQNVGCLTAAKIDTCNLANNHTLDWGFAGLSETLETLDTSGLTYAGAGRNAREAESPAILNVTSKGRVLLFAYGSITSGVPAEWKAKQNHAGLNVLEDLSPGTAKRVLTQMRSVKRPGDIAIASIHWGNNWGYEVPEEQIVFARRLIDEGFDIVFGHSSHHVKGMEFYRNKLILYGCGDFLNDYEGIHGYGEFRGDLALMYFVTVNPDNGQLLDLRLVPMQTRRFQLHHASDADVSWLRSLLKQLCTLPEMQFELDDDHNIRWIPARLPVEVP